ncbi:hypothetical protein HU200_016464 [Digitaria exilis]|uniref:Leucine-rich repeat-containing N-terminal plant-type domain-containing protein n=1 Tax=Digitaria exilis TaxID=1010633 RepID=A0A835F8F8_9POAL|nr:hypothetical protein HU200_016464 [Digitaria exilis]
MHVTTNAPHLLLTIISTILFLTGSALQHQRPDASSCIHSERAALLSFRKGVTFDHTNRLATWHGQDCCRWKGVKCSNETGHVLELRLRNENTNLDFMDACNDENALSGQISSSLLSLEHLEHLDLSGNCVVEYGKNIPSFLGSMKNLRYLNLSFIPSIGEVPPQLGNLSRLQYLDLGFNDINSNKYSLDISWLKNLQLLQYLSMRRVNLSQLELSSNSFYHEIAYSWFWKATSLKYLDLSDHGFFGEFHDALENMSSLQVLDLSFIFQNNLVMKGNYKNLCSLEILDLSFNELQLGLNNFTGTLPNLMGHFTNLIILDLTDNNLIGSIPMELGYLSGLTTLHLGYNHLNGTVPTKIGGLANLISLDLSNNKFDGIITDEHFADQIGGTIPESFCTLKELLDLDLSSNALEGEIPHCFEFKDITFLQLSNNSLSGHFPAFLRKCTYLGFLDLGWNKLFGSLPEWIGEVNKLQFLRLSHNIFSGNIPIEITNLNNLQYLDLSGNDISGSIPPHLSNLTGQELIYGDGLAYYTGIDLSGNSLAGEIPLDITSLDALINLNLSSNNLSGKIPNKIGAMQSLESLDLSKNKFFGEYQ